MAPNIPKRPPTPQTTSSTSSPTSSPSAPFFSPLTELADLGRERFDHDTAEPTSRDHALFAQHPVLVPDGRAPRGLESKVFAWTTFQHTTDERDDREELKGDLHEGQLHRQNRVARGECGFGGMDMGAGSGSGIGRGRGRGGYAGGNRDGEVRSSRGSGGLRGRGGFAFGGARGGAGPRGGGGDGGGANINGGADDGLCAGRMPTETDEAPLAKGLPEQEDKSMFWDEPIA